MKEVVITVNGPGEISAWLYPLARALKAKAQDLHLVVALVPCVFSSGAEETVTRAIEGIDDVIAIPETMRFILWGRRPPALGRDRGRGRVVMHLGGELGLSVALARRLGATLYGYVEYPNLLLRHFDRIYTNGLAPMPPRIGRLKPEFVGEMMVDAARLRAEAARVPETDGRTVAVFPGSREYMVAFLLPYFAPAIDRIAAERPDLSWVLAKSDFIGDTFIDAFPDPPADRNWRASPVRFERDAEGRWAVTEGGTRLRVLDNSGALAAADVALTIPGTNTGEMAALGVPMLTVIPTYEAGYLAVPLPGVAGYIERVPVLGDRIKILAGKAAVRKLGLSAQPNRRAGRRLVPELVGRNLHMDIVRDLSALLDGDLGALSDAVRATMGDPGAADRLADEILLA